MRLEGMSPSRHFPLLDQPPEVLELKTATYAQGLLQVTLEFDRDINIAGLVGSQITVDDGQFNARTYQATGAATLLDAQTVRIGLVQTGLSAGADVRLTASASTGIVAVDDGGAWPGVTNQLLPFP